MLTFFDISRQRLVTLKNEGYDVASSLKEAIAKSEICFICVNTPQNINKTDAEASDFVDFDLGKHQDLSQICKCGARYCQCIKCIIRW